MGNPNLQPETTWVADVTHERRFGDIGLFKLRLYYHWISNVEDLLPLTSDFEAPGNIGNGNRRGIEVESTVPMDWLGIKSSRLDFRGRVQDSSVTDPVTGEKRQLTSVGRLSAMIPSYNDIDLDYIIAVDFRQDFEVQSMAWGWEVRERAERPRFKVNELDVFNEGTELNFFVETTRWLGMKIQFKAKDVFDSQKLRTRTIYTGERNLSAIDRNEITDVTRGRQFEILFNGNF